MKSDGGEKKENKKFKFRHTALQVTESINLGFFKAFTNTRQKCNGKSWPEIYLEMKQNLQIIISNT